MRIDGDGNASGGVFEPSSTVANAGTVSISGNTIAFTGVGPLVVNGLQNFKEETPPANGNLSIDSVQVPSSTTQQLQLHTLTINGVVTWTQTQQLSDPTQLLNPLQVGRAIAVPDLRRDDRFPKFS